MILCKKYFLMILLFLLTTTLFLNANDDDWMTSDGITFLINGNVGIGTILPEARLDVVGAINADEFTINGIPIGTSSDSYWSTDATGDIYYDQGKVGIGTKTPVSELDVVGNIEADSITINGVPVSTSSDSYWNANGSDIYYYNGGVGIGITNTTSLLHLHGELNQIPGDIAQLTITGNSPRIDLDHSEKGFIKYRLVSRADSKFGIENRTEGYSALIIDKSGKVGISTTDPKYKLHVKDLNDAAIAVDSGNDKYSGLVLMENGNDKWAIYNDGSRDDKLRILSFETGQAAVTINNEGNVGIGTSDSIGNLHVKNNDITERARIQVDSVAYGSQYEWLNNGKQIWYSSLDFKDNSLRFGLIGIGEKVTFTNAGYVGIGTTDPTSKLQVTGLPEYTDNDDALANGHTIGAFYRTGDLLKVVH